VHAGAFVVRAFSGAFAYACRVATLAREAVQRADGCGAGCHAQGRRDDEAGRRRGEAG
jgi:hypothetical protein